MKMTFEKRIERFTKNMSGPEELASLKNLARSIFKTKNCCQKHQKALFKTLIWQATVMHGKYQTRFRSLGVVSEKSRIDVQHEHVYTKKQQVEDLLESAMNIDEVFDTAIGCMVTKAEHQALTEFGNDFEGWKRYKVANIAVFDMQPRKARLTSKGARSLSKRRA